MIWVVSDTHLTQSRILPEAFVTKVAREDIILHLGDLISMEIMKFLQSLCVTHAVKGNCDHPDVRRLLPSKETIEIDGYKIGMIHGRGGPKETLRLVIGEFAGKADVVLFGHTHIPYHARENGMLIFNPGSLRSSREGSNSFGVLHLNDEPWGEIIEV